MSLCVDDRLVCRSICSCIPDGRPHRVTYTRHRIDTTNSPDDGLMVAQNMYRTEINIYEKFVCQFGLFTKTISWGFQQVEGPRFHENRQGCQPYAPATFTPYEIFLLLISVRG